jgi:hypothetical protein
MKLGLLLSSALVASSIVLAGANSPASAQQLRPPNILVIMGDDVGWFNIGAYHRGIMSGKTPNLDKLASEGMMFTDYYAEQAARRVARTSLLARYRSARG